MDSAIDMPHGDHADDQPAATAPTKRTAVSDAPKARNVETPPPIITAAYK
jgi:hypothetical protein